MKEIIEIIKKIKINSASIEEAIRYIELTTVTKLDIQFIGNGFRITGYKWNTYNENDCTFVFMYESHKTELRAALNELANKILNKEIKVGK